MEIDVYNLEGKQEGKSKLPEHISGSPEGASLKVNKHLLHEVVRAYLANQRKGTHSTKTRSEVAGSNKKPWKQKHTGRARAGSSKSPLWKGGGIIFGPKPRSYRIDLPKTKVKSAFSQVLLMKASKGDVMVCQKPAMDQLKTKNIVSWMKKLSLPKQCLLVLDKKDEKISLASRNLADFVILECRSLHPYDLLKAKKIVFTPEAVQCL